MVATMTGARAAISAQVTSGVPPPRRADLERLHACQCVHWATPTSAWASMASEARRYSSASQSTLRCR